MKGSVDLLLPDHQHCSDGYAAVRRATHSDDTEPVEVNLLRHVGIQRSITQHSSEDNGDHRTEVDEGVPSTSERSIREPGVAKCNNDEDGCSGKGH